MFSVGVLEELVREPNWADASGEALLCLDLRGARLPDRKARAIEAWLVRQTVPAVGLVDERCQILAGLDLALAAEADVELVTRRINEKPNASSILVQTTRATLELPISSALAMESLGYATLQGGHEFADWLAGYRKSAHPKSIEGEANPVRLARDGAHLDVVLDSPANRNALSIAMRDALSEAFSLVATDDSIESVTVSGKGPCFSAGGDLTEFGSSGDTAEAHRIRQIRMPALMLAPHAARYTFALHGACIGAGIELPAFAGRVTAARDTFFRLPEVAMGLIPGAGGCVSIPRRIGRHRTNFLAISGIDLSSADALLWGLIDEITD